ncbi:DUF1542 domain-containing protein [Fructobacillus sp. EFB-N1]|uniref:DUF1542 domain-containing protein n=1 Tax=Fructobacillus sp. EFB-N1 TaxID=1658766 RepID=UPI001379230F|nr:DUF1542 domain-containing protein [Fructobacillus sp. EFB-N1]
MTRQLVLQVITNDKNAAILQSAKEGAIAAITKVNQDVKTAIGNMKPLDPKEITAYQDQADNALATAKTQIDQETTVSAVNADQTSFTSQINGIQDAATLQNTKEDDNNQLDQYAQNAKNAIADKTGMPDLSDDQINQANAEIDAAVKGVQGQIDAAKDTDGIAKALADGKAAVDAVQTTAQTNSDTTVIKEKNTANNVIDDAAAKAKAAIANATNGTDITKAQNAGTDTFDTDTANAQLKSTKEAADAELTKYGQAAKDKIAAMPDLTPDQIKQADSDIDAAVNAGQANIDGAADAAGVAKALADGKVNVDKVQETAQTNSDTTVAKVAEPAPTPQPQPAPKQTPVLPMTSRLQKHHTDTSLLPLVALGLLTLFSGKRRRQHDDKK